MSSKAHYWAFISYSSKDKRWGQWLHRRLERYPIPKELQGTKLSDGTVIGKNLRPIFRDRDELSGSAELGPALEAALKQSRYLVVLCSPNSAKSEWVNKEIKDFKAMGREKNILALILEGEPNSGGDDECFPLELRYPTEPLAGDLRRDGDGKERGLLKIVAGAAQLNFDTLFRRHERAQRKQRLIITTLGVSTIATLTALSLYAFQKRSEAQQNAEAAAQAQTIAEENEQRAKNLLLSSYTEQGRQAFLNGDKAGALAYLNEARKIRPDCPGIEPIMADAWMQLSPQNEMIRGDRKKVTQLFFSPDGTRLATQDDHGQVRQFDLNPAKLTLTSDGFIRFKNHPLIFDSSPFLTGFFSRPNPEDPNYLLREIRRVDWHENSKTTSIPWNDNQSEPDLIISSPRGNRIATYTGVYQAKDKVQLWHLHNSEVRQTEFELSQSPESFHWAFSEDEETLVQLRYSGDSFDVTFRDAFKGETLQTFPLDSRPESFATHGNRMCVGLYNGEVIEFERSEKISRRSSPANVVMQIGNIQYSNDGSKILVCGILGNIVLYDTENLSVITKLNLTNEGIIRHAALSKAARYISVSHESNVSVYDTSTGELYNRFSWSGSDASCSTFTSDDSLIAAGTDSGNIRIWNLTRQEPWLREHQCEKESSLLSISPVSDGEFFVSGRSSYLLETSTGKWMDFEQDGARITATSANKKLVQLGDSLTTFSVVNTETEAGIATPWGNQTLNVFLPDGAPAAGVVTQENGFIQAYSSKPAFLPRSYRSEDVAGNPWSIASHPSKPTLYASFADGSIIQFGVSEEGITNAERFQLPADSDSTPVLLGVSDEFILLFRGNRLAVYELSSKSLTELPRENLRSGVIFELGAEASILTIDSFGVLELWNREGILLANAASPVQKIGSVELLGGEKGVGPTILLQSTTAYTSFGNQLFRWSLPELTLIWRSPEIPVFNPTLIPRFVSPSSNQVLVTDVGYASSNFTKIFAITPPTLVPSTGEVDDYLSRVAGISIHDGRLIRR